jgi:serine/threonine-protein kinase
MDHPARVGKYQVEKFLGGGMAHVYRATDTVLGRTVALKILTDAGNADQETKARFFQEARVASNVAHENIINVYDFGEEQGRPFMVMEFLEGESLRSAIKHGRAGDLARRIRIALQVGRALDHIHSKKIIHRDVKPENVHLDASGKVKMMDFGIAKPEGVNLTRAGFTLGTPYYMAPEQVLGHTVTPQADIYAFGLLLFELLAGKRAVEGEKVEQIFEHILYRQIDLNPLAAAGIPGPLIEVIGRCVAKQPAQRPARLAILCDEIERIAGIPSGARPLEHVAHPIVEVQNRTVTTKVPTLSGLPGFLGRLPPSFHTQTALMLLAGAVMAALVTIVYVTLVLTHVF